MLKKLIVFASMAVLALALVGCSSSGASKPEMEGFNTSTNIKVEFGNLALSIPDYYKADSANTKTDQIAFSVEGDDGCTLYVLKTKGDKENYDKADGDAFLKTLNLQGEVKGSSKVSIAGLDGVEYQVSAEGGAIRIVKCFDSKTNTVYVFLLFEDSDNKKSYVGDFKKILENATYQEPKIDPDFKAAMDEYEKFFDEYVEIMEKYLKNPSDLSLLSDYSSYMNQYNSVMKKLKSIDTGSLNADELAYYNEVNGRIMNKLAGVAG